MAAAAPAASGPAAPRTKTKKKQKRFVPQRVKVPRAADPLLAVLAWGVNHQINELSQVPLPVMLLPDDFKASSKIKVNNHLFNRENLPSHFKFKEYCPQVFRNLRERFGIDDQDYQVSLTRSPPHWEGGDRRFLLSSDRTLVVKELSSEDVADVHDLLSHYHQVRRGPRGGRGGRGASCSVGVAARCPSRSTWCSVTGARCCPRFLGMYRLSVDSEDTYLLVMRNTFSHRLPVHRKYDLKGSLVSREASDKEKGKDLPTLKDMDFLNKNEKVYVGEEAQREFMEKLKRDVEFLVQLKIMDYSLLLGIHELGGGAPTAPPPRGSAVTSTPTAPLGPGDFDPSVDVYALRGTEDAPRREVYFMGLIDVLTQYDARKKAAHAAKTVKHGAGAEISTVHPEQYAKRFLDFITNIFA
ncbi:hypothetical protein Q9233_017706 [Columba guinea]|nr:hypothetical protein Q9233_017706 [Columba guinea]